MEVIPNKPVRSDNSRIIRIDEDVAAKLRVIQAQYLAHGHGDITANQALRIALSRAGYPV
jgi:hypothetical protein